MAWLRKKSAGSATIKVAVLDGVPDLSHPCFSGANLQRIDNTLNEAAAAAPMSLHATHIVSTLFGQPGSVAEGAIPACQGLLIPIFSNTGSGRIAQFDLARAINLAIAEGARVINISGGEAVADAGATDPMLRSAVQACRDNDIVIVAAAGNDGCACLHTPACLPTVLAVGALGQDCLPMPFSNHGQAYQDHGILAPGQNIVGARIGGGTAELSGTSFAAPLVCAVLAQLLDLQQQRGIPPSPTQVCQALIDSALPCPAQSGTDCRQYLTGSLNIPGAYALLFNGENMMSDANFNLAGEAPASLPAAMNEGAGDLPTAVAPSAAAAPGAALAPSAPDVALDPGRSDAAVGLAASAACGCTPSGPGRRAGDAKIFALGKVSYDFATDANRDALTTAMKQEPSLKTQFPDQHISPFNPHQMVAFLDAQPWQARSLIWTLNLDLTPIYVIVPQEPFAENTYALLAAALRGQIMERKAPEYVERISIPGTLSGSTQRLYSGQTVPVVLTQPRGLYFWNSNLLIKQAIKAVFDNRPEGFEINTRSLENKLQEFLNIMYYRYRNLGQTSGERALNFAATNIFQSADAFAESLAHDAGRQLARITVAKSPICRIDSDCWDVTLVMFDPENDRRSDLLICTTVDVSGVMPVTMGEARTWNEPGH